MKIRRLLPALTAAFVVACAGTNIGDPNDYRAVPLNRVFPYPSPDDLAQQKTEVTLATHYTTELPRSVAGPSITTVQQRLLRVLTEAGARVIDRSLDDLNSVRKELSRQNKGKRGGKDDVAWVLITRLTKYNHSAQYKPPSSIFKSQEELDSDPGTCTHKGKIVIDVKAFLLPGDDTARSTFTLSNGGEFEQLDPDESCPITDARRQQLMDEVLEEALVCVGTSIKNQFSPRGYVEEHRVSGSGDTHIYKTSLGRANGARPGINLSIFRVQYMTTSDGEQEREERRIGEAVISDELGENFSWVSVNVGGLEQQLLAGDMVRAVYTEPLTADLGFGGCNSILAADIDHR